MGSNITFKVSIPTHEGFYGRECNATGCGKHFRVHEESLQDEMHCPYCGVLFKNDELWTQEQLRYAKEQALNEAKAYAQDQLSKMLRDVSRGSKFLSYKPGPRARPKRASRPREPEIDSELSCPTCQTRFQVLGVFGFCPGCSSENLLLFDANFEIIRQEIDQAANVERALRHAYGDLVSTFELFCSREARRRGIGPARFQNITHTRRMFRKEIGADILGGFDAAEKRLFKRIFAKRHIWEHNGGVANEKYTAEVPEDSKLLGQPVPLSLGELEEGARLLRVALAVLVNARV